MRRAAYSICIGLFPTCIRAQGGEELGHHWESRLYWGEMHTQFVIMLAVVGLIAALEVFAHLRRSRR